MPVLGLPAGALDAAGWMRVSCSSVAAVARLGQDTQRAQGSPIPSYNSRTDPGQFKCSRQNLRSFSKGGLPGPHQSLGAAADRFSGGDCVCSRAGRQIRLEPRGILRGVLMLGGRVGYCWTSSCWAMAAAQ